MTARRLRIALLAAAAAALFTVPSTAAADDTPDDDTTRAAAIGCAVLYDYNVQYAAIYNQCGHGIYASVEVSGWNPACVYIDPGSIGYVTLDPGDVPEHAYEC